MDALESGHVHRTPRPPADPWRTISGWFWAVYFVGSAAALLWWLY